MYGYRSGAVGNRPTVYIATGTASAREILNFEMIHRINIKFKTIINHPSKHSHAHSHVMINKISQSHFLIFLSVHNLFFTALIWFNSSKKPAETTPAEVRATADTLPPSPTVHCLTELAAVRVLSHAHLNLSSHLMNIFTHCIPSPIIIYERL